MNVIHHYILYIFLQNFHQIFENASFVYHKFYLYFYSYQISKLASMLILKGFHTFKIQSSI